MRTHFSEQKFLTQLRQTPPARLTDDLSYLMWETSTEAMMSIGVPTNEDVYQWILVLSNREDSDNPDVQHCLAECYDYVNNT